MPLLPKYTVIADQNLIKIYKPALPTRQAGCRGRQGLPGKVAAQQTL